MWLFSGNFSKPGKLPGALHPVVIYFYVTLVPIYANFIWLFFGNLSKPDKLPGELHLLLYYLFWFLFLNCNRIIFLFNRIQHIKDLYEKVERIQHWELDYYRLRQVCHYSGFWLLLRLRFTGQHRACMHLRSYSH